MHHDELPLAIRTFRAELHQEVLRLVKAFEEKTGVTPSAISIPMLEATQHGDRLPKYVVGSIRLRFDF